MSYTTRLLILMNLLKHVAMADRYITDREFRNKAIDILDEVSADTN